MKHILTFILAIYTFSVVGQISFNTGSAQLDSDLNSINAYASLNFGEFKADLAIDYDISDSKIEFMRTTISMTPADIFMALEISRLSNRPIVEIIHLYKVDKNKGWGYIAKQAGIKPGSPEFHQLKNSAGNKKPKANKNNKGKGNSKSKKG